MTEGDRQADEADETEPVEITAELVGLLAADLTFFTADLLGSFGVFDEAKRVLFLRWVEVVVGSRDQPRLRRGDRDLFPIRRLGRDGDAAPSNHDDAHD